MPIGETTQPETVVSDKATSVELLNRPQQREILNGLQKGDSPLDFIMKNLRTPVEPVNTMVNETIKKVEEVRAEPKVILEEPKKEETVPAPEKTRVISEPEKKVEILPEEVTDKEENFKTLRKKVHETQTALKEKEQHLEEVNTKLKKYETGEEVPEPVKKTLEANNERLQKLEKYEHLHALKISPAYKEKYVVPLESVKGRLGEIAADYALPNSVLEEAISLTNKKELNEFLSEHFDDVGALEVKELVLKAQILSAEARAAENEPQQALRAVEEDFKNIQAARKAQQNAAIVEKSKGAWVDSLRKIQEEGNVPELIERESDPEYNKKVVTPIRDAAAKEYGKMIKDLADHGLEDLPQPLAFALARMVHLAHASAVSLDRARAAEKELAEVTSNMKRTTNYIRPLRMNGSGNGTAGEQVYQPQSPKEAGQMLVNSVLRNKRS